MLARKAPDCAKIGHMNLLRAIRLLIIAVVGALLVAAVFFAATYLVGWLGLTTFGTQPRRYAAFPTPTHLALNTPLAPFEQLNPQVNEILSAYGAGYGFPSVPQQGALQPLGAYLPQSGNRQFALQDPTPLPTPLPYPTSPPLPVPTLPPNAPLPGSTEAALLGTLAPPLAGQTLELLANCAPSGLPVDGILTQRYHRYHLGIDIGVPTGTAVLATHSGQVIYAAWSDIGYGYLVILQNGAFITYYAHNSAFNVTEGQQVARGDVLAWSGSTGNSTGPHVHYETRINDVNADPLTFENRGYGTC